MNGDFSIYHVPCCGAPRRFHFGFARFFTSPLSFELRNQESDALFIYFSWHQEVAKPRERRVSFAPAGRDGVDESRVREAAGNPSSGNNNATSTGSMLVLLGGVKPAPPKLSATAIVAAGEGASKRSRCLIDEGKEVSEQSQGRDKVKRVVTSPSKPSYSHGRGGGEGDESSSSRGSRVCRDNESKTKEQAAKMAKRRQRYPKAQRSKMIRIKGKRQKWEYFSDIGRYRGKIYALTPRFMCVPGTSFVYNFLVTLLLCSSELLFHLPPSDPLR